MNKKLLHVGCGPKDKTQTTTGFNHSDWHEIRLDIDPQVKPDIIGSLIDMSAVDSASMDAIFSSHNLEHIYAHEVPLALKEFIRVLKKDGIVVLTCPDLQSVSEAIAKDQLTEPLYTSPAGPIAAIDILYGHRVSLQQGNLFMAHKCGFTQKVLLATFKMHGFNSLISIKRNHPFYDLWILASPIDIDEATLKKMAAEHFPN
jgi:predicted SAM-dependent methyltransferase